MERVLPLIVVLIVICRATGHKMSTWKNRYFVLTATTLYYYKEEVRFHVDFMSI